LVKTQIIFQVIKVVLDILTVTLDVRKLWSLSEKLFSYKFDWALFLIFQAFVALLCVRPVRLVRQTGLSRDSFLRTHCQKKLETFDEFRKFRPLCRKFRLV